jgi:hypothetical protein
MTSVTDVCNRCLQVLGTRTTVTDAELAAGSTNESIQFNLIYPETRDRLLRMAPWNSAMRTANMTYITSSPGTPENTTAPTTLWAPGQPPPPWAYEYQYPVDCLMPRWIIPSTQTGFADAVPITTAVTGGASSYWWGQPIRYKVQNDTFYTVDAVIVPTPGTGYAVGDLITLALQPSTASITNRIGTFNAGAPQGAAATLEVLTVNGSGGILTAEVLTQIEDESIALGGSYYYDYATTTTNAAVPAGSTTGAGTGAIFSLTFDPPQPQRVILTNQEFATLVYTQQVTDPNVWDPSFREALYSIGGAKLIMALVGNRDRANDLVKITNDLIRMARGDDGNEGLTINDVTPDWIRTRGIYYTEGLYSGPYQGYDWGNFFPLF